MKRLALILCFTILSSVCLSAAAWSSSIQTTPVPGNYSTPNFTVTVSSKRIYNNHVGNSWGKWFTVGGIEIKKSGKVYVDPTCGIAIQSEFEEDDKSPDYGRSYQVYIPTAEDMAKGFSVTQQVYVYENRGRYSGNDALWEATYKFKPIKKK